ncbi:hypothetical protein GCM10029964_098170 [Kibdelosporangium lantanae]
MAVPAKVMVTGSSPHENVITPPAATADRRDWDVQLPAVPSPTTRVGLLVSSAFAAAGTAAFPAGLPAAGMGAFEDVVEDVLPLVDEGAEDDVGDGAEDDAEDGADVVAITAAGTSMPGVVVAQPATVVSTAKITGR